MHIWITWGISVFCFLYVYKIMILRIFLPIPNKSASLEVDPGISILKCSPGDYNVKPNLRTKALEQFVYDIIYLFFEGIRKKIFVL